MSNIIHLKQPHITTLADKAMLVRLKISKWNPYAYDETATATVEVANGVTKAGRFNKALMKGNPVLAEVNAAYNAVYLYHTRHTVPWLDDGVRMLPAALYFDYTQEIRPLISEADRAANKMAANWTYEVAKDIARLGPLGNVADYPADIRPFFRADLRFQPVPQEGDFRVAISDDDRASLAQSITDAENAVVSYLIGEMMEPVKKLAQRCGEFQGAKGERWHHSLVTNIEEIIYRLPKLNINNDPAITQIIGDLRTTIRPYTLQPDALKDSAVEREQTKAKLDELMKRMGGLYGG